jgi:hypothetical protein
LVLEDVVGNVLPVDDRFPRLAEDDGDWMDVDFDFDDDEERCLLSPSPVLPLVRSLRDVDDRVDLREELLVEFRDATDLESWWPRSTGCPWGDMGGNSFNRSPNDDDFNDLDDGDADDAADGVLGDADAADLDDDDVVDAADLDDLGLSTSARSRLLLLPPLPLCRLVLSSDVRCRLGRDVDDDTL